ncbi:MAG: hypothetical protein DYG98_03500 [Haliscomenobacteraceae bacterium CHB4]|nr:hypothetical protein [Saprospiraceae bacterium]MCE7922097.1 hypothetical protein [Haliscomenobacteraceae bacterium CHB4]
MKKPVFYLLGLGLALFLGACDKDSDASNTDKLTNGQWKITSWVAKFTFNGVDQTVDVYAQSPACDKDDFAEFNTDGTLVLDEGATKCNPIDPQQETGTWELTQNETHLVVTSGDLSFDAEIVELTDSKLTVEYEVNQNGIVTTNEIVFEKI